MDSREEYKIYGYVKSTAGLRPGANEDNFLLDRRYNEDSSTPQEAGYYTKNLSEWNCFGVFDGIGGEDGGEIASRITSEVFCTQVEKLCGAAGYDAVDAVVREGFMLANNRIVDENLISGVCGTTGTIFVTDGIVGKVYHIGDSRAYLLREGVIYQMTTDQTMAQMKVELGLYESPEAATEQEKHQLTEFIGRDKTGVSLRPSEGSWIEFREGDTLLLCTDGFFDFCSPAQIRQQLMEERPLGETVGCLIDMALESGSDDNITCAVISKKGRKEQ